MKQCTQFKTRILSLAAAAVIGLSGLTQTALAARAGFADVPRDHWSYAWVMEAVELELVAGTSGTTFEPETETTIAHFATVITKAFYADDLAKANTGGAWWRPFLETANSRQLLTGTSAYLAYSSSGQWTQAIAEQSLTRNEMADVIAKLLADKGMTPSREQVDAARAAIPDYAQIPSQYKEAAAICVAAEILSGKEGGLFCGEDHFNRAEMACVIVKLCRMIEDGTQPAGPDPVEPEGPTLANGAPITQENVREIIEGLRTEYPEGMRWTNDNFYQSQALRRGGYGCEGFALICSDKAFGDLPITVEHSDFDALRAGDLIRMNNNTHTVVVLEKRENSVIVAEGNYNSSIHWGREITRETLEAGNFTVRTRYPE